MKKKEILKTIITIIVSVVLSSGISVYATSTYLYDSCDVSYDNTSSGLNATNVQSSLDELYMHATDYTELKNYFQNNPTSYFYGNDLRIGANDTSNHESYINFYSSNVNRGAIGISNVGDMQIVSKNASGVNGQGTLNLIGNPVMINGKEVDSLPKFETIIDKTNYTSSTSYQPLGNFNCTENSLLLIYTPFVNATVTGVKLTLNSSTGNVFYIDENASDFKTGVYVCNGNYSLYLNVKNGTAGRNNWYIIKKISF